jgi:hypothetical protein
MAGQDSRRGPEPTAEPWFLDEPPHALTRTHFEVAGEVLLTGVAAGVGNDEIRPLAGAWAYYFTLYGTQYPENQVRLDRLRRVPPLAFASDKRFIVPGILCIDPSPSETDVRPMGVATEVGYLGSAWCRYGTAWAEIARKDIPRRRFYATRLLVTPETWHPDSPSGGPEVEVWIPVDEAEFMRKRAADDLHYG